MVLLLRGTALGRSVRGADRRLGGPGPGVGQGGGHGGHRGFARALPGPVGHQVARHAPCPVVIVRPRSRGAGGQGTASSRRRGPSLCTSLTAVETGRASR
ncbi:universal stress protein [Streptomyces sp. NPDC003480]